PGRPPVAGALSRSRARPGKVPIVATIPKSRLDQIQFCEDHLPIWVNEAPNIGLDAQQITDLTGLTTQARAAYTTQQQAKQAALAATADFHDKTDAMRAFAGALVSEIQAFAKSTDDPNVFVLAQIPA